MIQQRKRCAVVKPTEKSIWEEYSERVSIHGLRYAVQKKAKPWERIVWAILLAIASIVILKQFYRSWKMYTHTLTSIVIEDPRYPLSEIDFPAITVCSNNNIMYSKAKVFTEKISNDSDVREIYENTLEALSIMRYPHYNALENRVQNRRMFNIPPKDIYGIMMNLGPTIDDMFLRCYWRGMRHECTDMFRRQRTELGFCYSFNSKTAERYANDSERNPPLIGSDGELVPLRNNAAGKMSGIELVLKNMEDELFPKDRKLKGYNIMVHTPDEFPDETVSYTVQVDINKVSQISVSVSKVCADQSLHWVKKEDKKCSMYHSNSTDSQQSSLFCKSPSEGTCFRKCRLDIIYKLCNCIPYYCNTETEKKQSCGVEHMMCLSDINVRQRNFQAPENEQAAFPEWSLPAFMNCSCPTPCSFTSYTTENRMITMYTVSNMTLGPDHMYLDIHYKDPYAISYSRSIKYSTEDLMVAFGGMASLFLGCSLVTLVEVIYFVYRLLVTLKRRCSTVDVKQLQNNNVNYPFCP